MSPAIAPNPPRWHPNPDPNSINVPGLDTAASTLEQIEQIEQLITIKLQNIDENFSKIHNVLANKILPAVKRYAVGTEPIREAAKFWTSFYEQAAQIRIPTYDDYSSLNDPQSHSDHEETQSGAQVAAVSKHSSHVEPSIHPSESSFMPAQAAYSSTPATVNNRGQDVFGNPNSETPSWVMGSPLARLGLEVKNLSKEVESMAQPAQVFTKEDPPVVAKHDVPIQPNVDKVNATRTPVPRILNPYLPPNTHPADWSGIVDLSDPSMATPKRPTNVRPSSRRPVSSRRATPGPSSHVAAEESFEGLPVGMSPPVMMSPARPPRSSAELLGQTPVREAAQRIGRDLLSDMTGAARHAVKRVKDGGVESSMSTVPTPPSLSRYHERDGRYVVDTSESTALDSSLESMMRRVGLNMPGSESVQYAAGPTTPVDNLVTPPPHPIFNPAFEDQEPLDSDSDSDSLDEENNTAHPSAAFMMASQGRRIDDSFASSSDSFSGDEMAEGAARIHPFAMAVENDTIDDSFDDSFEGNGPTETLFGVPPARREATATRPTGELRLLGGHIFGNTIGGSSGMSQTEGVEESPTPVPWPGMPLG